MNHDPSSSDTGASSSAHYEANHREAAPTEAELAELAERRKKNRQMFNRKRLELLDDLLRNLDILVYAEMSVIYYMDCSFLRFLLRALVQFMFLTPKPPMLPDHLADRANIGPLLGSNIICFLLHLFLTPPSAGEPTRGYLHGGLAMDFIGQKGPTSKVHLLLLDVLLVSLQVTHMAANMVRKRLRDASASASGAVSEAQTTAPAAPGLQQDLDSEERGVNRSDEAQDIEMQNLNASGSAATGGANLDLAAESSEQDTLLATTAPRSDAHIFDAFNSGQIVVADLDIWRAIKEQWQMLRYDRANATEQMSQAQTLRAELAGRMLRMRIGTDMIRQNSR